MTTQTGAGAPDVTSAITSAHLVVILILAALAMLVIWWGGRRRHERIAAKRESVERREQAGDAAAPPAPLKQHEPATVTAPPAPAPAQPIPVAPPPPPLADAPVAAPLAPAPDTGGSDVDAPVTLLKGLGPKVAARLGELGITRVGQLAALSPSEADALDAQLGTFSGRMERDRWIEQARLLAAGDRAGYEATFGKLG